MTILPIPIIIYLYHSIYEQSTEYIEYFQKYKIQIYVIIYEFGCILYPIIVLFIIKPCLEFRSTGLYVWSICQMCAWCMFTIAHVLFLLLNMEAD